MQLLPRWARDRGIATKVMAVILGALALGAAFMVLYLWHTFQQNTRDQAVANARNTIQQYQELRAYYTNQVAAKITRRGILKISHEHKDKPDTVPLPATVIHDLSAELSKHEGAPQFRLYSEYPFPNRRDRVLDQFARDALAAFRSGSDEQFVRVESVGGEETVRVAVPDRMVAAACVSCHNRHPESPKRDWKLGDVRGVLEVSAPIGPQLRRNAVATRNACLIVVGSAAALAILLGLLLRRLSSRLRQSVRVIEAFAAGDLSQRQRVGARDEVGRMAEALNQALDRVSSTVQSLDSNSQTLAASSEELATVSEQMSTTAVQTSVQAAAVTEAATQVSARAQTVAAAAEQMSATSQEIAQHAGEAVRVVTEGVRAAEETNRTVDQLGVSGNEIGTVVRVIKVIAEQTELLALNAMIEAARAGEAGQGFAVVANAVAGLAKKTATATEDVRQKIDAIQCDSRAAAEALGRIGDRKSTRLNSSH